MKYSLAIAILLSGLASPRSLHAQPAHELLPTSSLPPLHIDQPPPSGIGGLVMGGVGLGLGTVNLATIPVCYAEFYPPEAKNVCIGMSVGLGVALISVGIPSLIIGKKRHDRYRAWRARQSAGLSLEGVGVLPQSTGAQLMLQARF